jgi:hypothetical protein
MLALRLDLRILSDSSDLPLKEHSQTTIIFHPKFISA